MALRSALGLGCKGGERVGSPRVADGSKRPSRSHAIVGAVEQLDERRHGGLVAQVTEARDDAEAGVALGIRQSFAESCGRLGRAVGSERLGRIVGQLCVRQRLSEGRHGVGAAHNVELPHDEAPAGGRRGAGDEGAEDPDDLVALVQVGARRAHQHRDAVERESHASVILIRSGDLEHVHELFEVAALQGQSRLDGRPSDAGIIGRSILNDRGDILSARECAQGNQ